MLKMLKSVVPVSGQIPLLTHVKVKDGRVFATNMEYWAEAPWPLAEGFDPCCIPFKELSAFLGLLDADAPTKTKQKDGAAVVSSGRRRVTMPTLDVGDFPDLAHVGEDGESVSFDAADLKLVLHAAALKEKVFPQLAGVSMRGDQLAATDRARVVRRAAKTGDADIILPGEFCRVLLGAIPEGPVKLRVTENLATWRGPDDVVLTSKLIGGKFPDVDRVWPDPDTASWVLWDAEEFDAALGTVELSTGSDGVTLNIKDGKTRWTSRDNLGKEFVYEGTCDDSDLKAPVDIRFRRKLLREALAARDEDVVRLGITGTDSAALYGDDEVIMPWRV